MFDIAILFHTLKKYDEALRYYEKSEALFGEQFNIIFNKALCYYYLGETQKSLHLFRQAHAQDKTSEQVQEWIHFLESGDQPAL
jgi:tetratricopeptide (TPR) repeat protein